MDNSQLNYIAQATELLGEAKQLFNDSDWKHVSTKNGIDLHSMDNGTCPFPAYRVRSTFNKSKDELVNNIWGVNSVEQAKVNDPKLVSWERIAFGDNWKVISQTNTTVWPIWPRQIIFCQVKFEEEDHTYLVGRSVDHQGASLVDGHVLAHLHMSVYDYCDNKNGTTTVNRITLLDPKGQMPVGLVTMYAGNLVNLFESWRN